MRRATTPERRTRSTFFQWLLLLATIAFGILFWFARKKPYFGWDLKITLTLQKFVPHRAQHVLRALTWPGFPPQLIALVVIPPLWLYRAGLKWEAVSEIFGLAGIGVFGTIIKVVANRPRPDPRLVHCVNSDLDDGKYSFVATHVSSYVAVFGFLWFLNYLLYPKKSRLQKLEQRFYEAMIALVGPERVLSGEHWTSDVIGGYLLGSIWLAITIYFYRWGKNRFFVEARNW